MKIPLKAQKKGSWLMDWQGYMLTIELFVFIVWYISFRGKR